MIWYLQQSVSKGLTTETTPTIITSKPHNKNNYLFFVQWNDSSISGKFIVHRLLFGERATWVQFSATPYLFFLPYTQPGLLEHLIHQLARQETILTMSQVIIILGVIFRIVPPAVNESRRYTVSCIHCGTCQIKSDRYH